MAEALAWAIFGKKINEMSLQGQRLFLSCSLHLQGHQRGRRGADRACLRLERNGLDLALRRFQHEHGDFIATCRIVARAVGRRRRQHPAITRALRVIQDNFLVQLVEVHSLRCSAMYYALMNSGGYGSTISANAGDGAAILVAPDFLTRLIFSSPL